MNRKTSYAVAPAYERKLLALLIGPAAWLIPHQGIFSTMLPQRIAQLAPDNKVTTVALISSVSMVIAAVANMMFGACSDMTRSRFGRRTPWIVVCSLLCAAVLVLLSLADTLGQLMLWFFVYEIVVNGVAAAMIAWLSDQVSPEHRGTASAVYSIGTMIGGNGGGVLAAAFLSHMRLGFWTMAAINLLGAIVACLLMAERSNVRERRPEPGGGRRDHDGVTGVDAASGRAGSAATLRGMMVVPVAGYANLYRMVIARTLMGIGSNLVLGYRVYLLTDYVGIDGDPLQRALAVISWILLIEGMVFCLLSGRFSNNEARLKPLVIASALGMGVSSLLPMAATDLWLLYACVCVNGVANGMNASAMQALSTAVLPNPATAAKDLGIMNLSNTFGAVFGSVVAMWCIDWFGYRGLFPTALVMYALAALVVACVHLRNAHPDVSGGGISPRISGRGQPSESRR